MTWWPELVNMAQPSQNTSLSLSTRLLCYLGPPSTVLLTSLASPRTGLLSPLAFIPPAVAVKIWRKVNKENPTRRGELEPLIWTFASTGTLGLIGIMAIQWGVFTATTKLLFGSGEAKKYFIQEFGRSTTEGLSLEELAKRAALAASWQNWVLNAALSFGMAGFLEETLKYLPVAYAKLRGTPEERRPRNRAYLDYAIAGALSFAVIENIGFLYAAVEGARQSWLKLAGTALERLVFASAGHFLAAALTALRATRRDYYGDQLSWWDIVRPSVILHGCQNFVAFSFGALEGNVGWIHPVGLWNQLGMWSLIGAVNFTAGYLVRQEWKELERRDEKATGPKAS